MKRSILPALVLVAVLACPGAAEIADAVSYQGVLTDAGGVAVPDGAYPITFRIYNVVSGGTPLWEETHPSVQVTKGIFGVMLGSVMKLDLPFDARYYLGVSVGAEAELAPRVELSATPYAFAAKGVHGESNIFPSSGNVGIGTSTSPGYPLVVTGESDTQVGILYNGSHSTYSSIYVNATQSSSRPAIGYMRGGLRAMTLFDTDDHFRTRIDGVNLPSLAPDGDYGIGVYSPLEKLDVAGAVRLGTTANTHAGTIRWTGSDFEGYDGSSWQSLTGSGGGALPPGILGMTLRHDGLEWHQTSNLYNDGIHIGIGTTSPATDVHVSGTGTMGERISTASANGRSEIDLKTPGGDYDYLRLAKYGASAVGTTAGDIPLANLSLIHSGTLAGPMLIDVMTADPLMFATGNVERMRLDATGNLGLGTTGPAARLHVDEDVRIGAASRNGSLTLYDELEQTTAALMYDVNGEGGYFYVKRDPTYTAFRVDGNYNGTGDPLVSIFGTGGSAVFDLGTTGDDAVRLPASSISNAEIVNEAGAASFEEGGAGVTIEASPAITVIASQSITVPTSGYVLAIATCQAQIGHVTGETMGANFGVSNNASIFPANQDVYLGFAGNSPTGTYNVPVTCSGLFQVSAGTRNYYMLGTTFGGTYLAYDRQLSLVFIPTAYGTVEPTIAGPGEDVPGEPMTAAELDAQRAASIAANVARMERELAELRAQVESLRQEEPVE